MEVYIESKLEFGDFETNENFESANDCVELPPSWLLESLNKYQLSFSVPSQCNGLTSSKGDVKELHTNVKSPNQQQSCKSVETRNTPLFEFSSDVKKQNTFELDQDPASKAFEQNVQIPNGSVTIPEKQLDDNQVEVFEENSVEEVHVNAEKEQNSSVSSQDPIKDKDMEVVLPVNGQAPEKSKVATQAKSQSSWAGLFKSEENAQSKMVILNGHQQNQVSSNSKEPKIQATVNGESHSEVVSAPNKPKSNSPSGVNVTKPEDDKNARYMAEMILKLDLKFKPQAFIPRGLINSSNWCYINATLQALLMCPPFYQLLKTLPLNNNKNSTATSTPTIDCFVKLASQFHPLSTKKGYQTSKEVRQGQPFTPECVYDMLSATKSSLSDTGSQEDAEEFLSCVLNGLHEEMVKLSQFINSVGDTSLSNDHENAINENKIPTRNDLNESDGEEWEEVLTTKRNRSAVTRRADTSETPISRIFRGELCTSVFRPGQKQSISHEPFYSLPLAIPADHDRFWSVEDAMYALTNKENFMGSDVDHTASRQQAIEILPPVLILHLKRFVYDKNGGSKKIDRKMEFKSDLIIPKDILSKSSKKYSHAQRTYKLFAVVCHHGERATGGHYTADVFHIGMSSWLRIDDQNIHTVSHGDVTRHNSNRAPYLLFYRRTDLG